MLCCTIINFLHKMVCVRWYYSFVTVTTSLQPVELSVNEREVVNMLTNELFHVIPPSNDLDIADITDSQGRDCMLIFCIM